MTEPNHPEFYARRERAARDLAARCLDESLRAIHLGMADRYAEMAMANSVQNQGARRSAA